MESNVGVLSVSEENQLQFVSFGDVRHVVLSRSVARYDEEFSVVSDSVNLQTVLGAAVGEDVAGINGHFDSSGRLKFKTDEILEL